jgi:GTPase SAR1 family protein
VTNQYSFDKAKIWIQELEKNTSPNVIIALVGNKVDVNERKISQQVIIICSKSNFLRKEPP